jgi:hypothetical protein
VSILSFSTNLDNHAFSICPVNILSSSPSEVSLNRMRPVTGCVQSTALPAMRRENQASFDRMCLVARASRQVEPLL